MATTAQSYALEGPFDFNFTIAGSTGTGTAHIDALRELLKTRQISLVSNQQGVYVVARRTRAMSSTNTGYEPVYVGKAEKQTFKQRLLNNKPAHAAHQCLKYAQEHHNSKSKRQEFALYFLYYRGAPNAKKVDSIQKTEKALIRVCVLKNQKLLNNIVHDEFKVQTQSSNSVSLLRPESAPERRIKSVYESNRFFGPNTLWIRRVYSLCTPQYRSRQESFQHGIKYLEYASLRHHMQHSILEKGSSCVMTTID